MSLLWSKNGFRGEVLARYIVSKFAFVSESTAGEDFGIDFYCGLSKESSNKKAIYFDKPFLLQIKTTETKPDIIYNSKNKINTLFGLDLPFFIAHLDLKSGQLDIYSTSMMWHGYLLCGPENINCLNFTFSNSMYGTNKENTLTNTPVIRDAKDGEKKNVTVYLGHPLISLKLSDIETNIALIDEARNILSKVIDKEFDNLQNKRLKLYYYRWAFYYETNVSKSLQFGYNFLTKDAGLSKIDTKIAISSMHHHLVALAIAYYENGDEENFENVCKVTRNIAPKERLKAIVDNLPSIYFESNKQK